ncbi:hypothetical protein [Sphingobacterium pedocola]|uniref:Transposase n=1 Tax=Sphingobacterium pedocola TaxID=2082722 RepID=A0ABR9T8Y4_9SPHI|nr:hypothetical protein [Sphingobacterium pedocola]MBE8721549.1 hypothetical protein [Sphingobacterium pedocola]
MDVSLNIHPPCKKVSFDNKQFATVRSKEINQEDDVKSQGLHFRAYRCPVCSKYHLTKMEMALARWINDIAYRNQLREEAFVRREVAYYNRRNRIRE